MVYLLERMESAARKNGAVTFLSPSGDDEVVSWGDLYADAVNLAAVLQTAGIGPGRSVVMLALASRPAVTAAMATWLAGGALTMAPTPTRTMDEAAFVAETVRRINRLGGSPLVLVGPRFDQILPGLATGGWDVRMLDDVHAEVRGSDGLPAYVPPSLTDDDPAILQLTSGTTASAKTVRVSHGNLAANVEAIKVRDEHDRFHGRILSWLPLSHDMGLIGTLIIPMTCGGCDLLLSSPLDYLARPASWMAQISEYRATSTVGPNSAYALAAKLLATGPALDLSQLRGILTGGESVDLDAMTAFTAAAQRHGFNPALVVSAYGMAETVVATTMTPLGRGLASDSVDADLLQTEGRAVPVGPGHTGRIRQLARLGAPVDGLRLRISDTETGAVLTERLVGEIQVHGTSLTAGYHNDPEATAASRTADGWLRTGDLGYLADGELVVTGRVKDVIILAGRNIYPEEVERAAAGAEGVRPGNVAAFPYVRPNALGSEGLAVALETRWPSERHAQLRSDVAAQIRAAVGVSPNEVLILPPGSLPKTPSGKLQRAEARRLLGVGGSPAETTSSKNTVPGTEAAMA
ncbi:fatty-acyl-CoA synthase [Parafrankia irregularis]|uniref:Fatty-acyl-CoA synthase n=1 Tax=Parafrankia irregularis TaxID=795642 RepID=A0A0S4QL47_9ACTN|nr:MULTISPECIES: long-chain-fatty-acid--CoA ligase [Parafrankia]MBE3203875.1 AMP-binding protein [Parafrankia sp. CH37]CUU55254.1 fatty-acyl-CoA synthase [Parafrankia irregularis]